MVGLSLPGMAIGFMWAVVGLLVSIKGSGKFFCVK